MMKSYANVLKGKTQVNKNITEESLPSNETYSYFLAKTMELQINHIMTDWKTVNPIAIKNTGRKHYKH